MKTLLLTLPLLLFLAPAQGADRGKTLHDQHCTSCHSSDAYTRKNHRVRSLEALKDQVGRCHLVLDLKWSQADIDAVVDYLNRTYYHFGE
ncbi:MAG: cytochrome c [Gammaproteobacteria bacterium]|nr:MAG: cytochrome c [Gammaproteobacteria bacterium]